MIVVAAAAAHVAIAAGGLALRAALLRLFHVR